MNLIKIVLIAFSFGAADAKKDRKFKLQACIRSYPGTTNLVNGKIAVTFDDDGTNDMIYSYKLRGLESNVTGGTHIHSGTSCYNANLVGGHYWDVGSDGSNPDPWTPDYGAVYSTNVVGTAVGSFQLNSGYSISENYGHAVVVHASDGSRVGCGVLKKGKTRGCPRSGGIRKLQACVSSYPGTTNDVSGKVVVIFNSVTGELTYKYRFRNLESSVTGGTHIHTGTTCDDATAVGGHYWDAGSDGTNPDPWTNDYGAVYVTNEDGSGSGGFTLDSTGTGFEDNVGRAVVIHAADGTRVGCGVLGKSKTFCG